jgi:lipopolysaccharide/colanic/teichoic acid biosynthesis glycosyltransferase
MIEEKVSSRPLLRAATAGVSTSARPLRRTDGFVKVEPVPASYRIAKRTLDIAVSLAVLIVLMPLLLLTVALIHATSRGPAIYRQRRVGEGGRIFTMYKFRSMYQNSDPTLHRHAYARFVRGKAGDGKVDRETLAELAPEAARRTEVANSLTHRPFKRLLLRVLAAVSDDDPRVTPVGAILRRTSIDELPQLFNVLIGDMSLVGPRPPIPYEVRLYERHHLGRLAIRPGVTGIWQVYGRGRVPFERMVDMDLEYIASRSFWLDLRLMLLTIPTVLRTRGAR